MTGAGRLGIAGRLSIAGSRGGAKSSGPRPRSLFSSIANSFSTF